MRAGIAFTQAQSTHAAPEEVMGQTVDPEARQFCEERDIRVGELSPAIHIRTYRRVSDGKIIVEQSHYLKTAIQYLPHAVNELTGSDPSKALDELEATIMAFYDQAIRRGYPPSNSWLVPNTAYPVDRSR